MIGWNGLLLRWQGGDGQVCIVELVWFRAILQKYEAISSQREKFIILMQVDKFSNEIYSGLYAFTTKNMEDLNIKFLVPPSCRCGQNFTYWYLVESPRRFCTLAL